jgi:hypothetical protein
MLEAPKARMSVFKRFSWLVGWRGGRLAGSVDPGGAPLQGFFKQLRVHGIQRVTAIVNAISAASDAQRAGVGQVEQALSRMDHGTQQNAAGVEECAAAADSLQQQSNALVAAVAVFSVGQPPAQA